MISCIQRFFPALWMVLMLFSASSLCAQQQLPDSLSQRIQHAKDARNKFTALHQAVNFYIEINNLDGLGDLAKEELLLAQTLKNDSLLGISYTDLGILFDGKSDFNQALNAYLKALRLFESEKNPGEIARVTNDISTIYSEIKNYPQTLNYLLKSASFAVLPEVRKEHNALIVVVYINLCEAFIALGKPDSALKYIQLANAENLVVRSAGFEAYMLGDFGWVYEKLAENDLAEMYYRKSVHLADSLKAVKFIADNAYRYSNFLLQQKRYPEANHMAMKSLLASQQQDYKFGVINATDVLRSAYFSLNKPDSAYYYANIQVNYRDSVYNQQNLNQIQDMTFSEQIRQAEENHRILEEKEKARRNIQYAAIAIGIIAFILLLMIFSRSIIASEKTIEVMGIIGLLISFEFINLLLAPFLVVLTKDSPLFMLLSMVLIAALLVPGHHRFEKWISEKLVEKNRKIRMAAAEKLLRKKPPPYRDNTETL